MPLYRFCLEFGPPCLHRQESLEDEAMARATAKHMARSLAARRVELGQLDLAEQLLVLDETGAVLHRLPLGAVIHVTTGSAVAA